MTSGRATPENGERGGTRDDPLLEPIQLGQLTLRNRIVLTAHLAFFNAYQPMDDARRYADYVSRRAEAGVAMISLQSLKVLPTSPGHPLAYGYLEERFAMLAEAAHKHGCAVIVQLQNFGYKQGGFGTPDMQPLWSFEALRSPVSYELAHKMTTSEVASVVTGYAEAAQFLVGCGLDGVELAGSHGYLLYQSLNTKANQRDDEWGRPMAFWNAVLSAIRDRIGSEAILGARVCSDDLFSEAEGGVGPAALREVAVSIAESGLVDYLNPTEGADFSDYGRVVGSFRRPHGDFLPTIRAIRAEVAGRVPVIGCGRLTTVEEAREALQRGDCDIVGMTRAHMADPDVIPNLLAGQTGRTRRCVGANLCIDRTNRGQDITCFHNPDLNRGSRWQPEAPATVRRRVLVVGGGPAGCKTAEIAARCGHQVTLLERSPALGGRLALLDDRVAAGELLGAITWMDGELAALKVDIQMGTAATPEMLAAGDADVIVLATGSVAADPSFPADGSVPVWTMDDVPRTPTRAAASAPLIVYDLLTNEESDTTWEQMVAVGYRVLLVTPHPATGTQLGYTHRVDHTRRLHEARCALRERTEIAAVRAGRVEFCSTFDGAPSSLDACGVVVVGQREPDLALYDAAVRAASDVRLVGDSIAPRTAFQAIREADALGRSIGRQAIA
jgi:2,4-dienoyl-CoA reductase-like NADH-dependent reductase (Old Yellow Enzyme family)